MNENPTVGKDRRQFAHDEGGNYHTSLFPASAETHDCCRSPIIAVLVGIAGYLEQWLWMRQLDYAGIFWTLLSVQWGCLPRLSSSPFCTCGSISARLPKTAPPSPEAVKHGA